MRPYSTGSTGSFTWYLKFLGIPLTLSAIMFKMFKCSQKKRKALLEKVVVITGASSGIGEALAHAFYEQGSKVVLVARRESELERVKSELIVKTVEFPTPEPVVIPLDLAVLDDIEPFVKKVQEICGHIDILINNGGVSHRASVMDTKIEIDQQIMTVNYFGAVALTKAILPQMIDRKSGHIAFVSSVQGLIAIPHRSAYAASKHAMQAFGDSLRAEMHQHHVNVTVISPGYVKTAVSLNALSGDGSRHGVMDKSTAAGFSPKYCADKIVKAIVNKKPELVVSQLIPKLVIYLRHWSPSIYFRLMVRKANETSW